MVTNLKINDVNKAKIKDCLREVQRGCHARCITVDDIYEMAIRVQVLLRVHKKDLCGTVADVDINATNFPGKYNGKPQSTQFSIMFDRHGAKLIEIVRADTRRYSRGVTFEFSEITSKAILKANRCFSL